MITELPDKDRLLQTAFSLLQARNISSDWATQPRPYSALRNECLRLMSDSQFVLELRSYLQQKPYVGHSVDMVLNYMSVSEKQTLDWRRPAIAMGQNIIRWIPTFLVIDGPIGRFLRQASPANKRLGENYPILTAARDVLENRDFKMLRHGFAHWNFDWEVSANDVYLIAYDKGKNSISTKLLLREVDAFHIVAFSLTEILDEVFFQKESGA